MLALVSDPPAADCPASSTFRYQRREPERTLLHRIVRENLATFLAEAADRYPSGELPAFSSEEFSRYLRCGILRHGFARVRCPACRDELLVAFSCKMFWRRGLEAAMIAHLSADLVLHVAVPLSSLGHAPAG